MAQIRSLQGGRSGKEMKEESVKFSAEYIELKSWEI